MKKVLKTIVLASILTTAVILAPNFTDTAKANIISGPGASKIDFSDLPYCLISYPYKGHSYAVLDYKVRGGRRLSESKAQSIEDMQNYAKGLGGYLEKF